MIPIPEKGESIYYYVPTSAYDTDNIPYDQIQDYLPAAFIGKAFGDDESAEFHNEELAIFDKTINAIESGELKAGYIENFDPDRKSDLIGMNV